MKIYNDREFPGILRYRDQFFPIPVPVLFSGTNFFRYRYRFFFRDQFFPVPGPVLFSGTKFFRYRYRYFFPGPNFSGTGTGTIQKGAKFPGPGCHTLVPRQYLNQCGLPNYDSQSTLAVWLHIMPHHATPRHTPTSTELSTHIKIMDTISDPV